MLASRLGVPRKASWTAQCQGLAIFTWGAVRVCYDLECAIYGLGGNVLARVLDVDKAMFDSGLDQVLGHLSLVASGDVNDGDVCNFGHFRVGFFSKSLVVRRLNGGIIVDLKAEGACFLIYYYVTSVSSLLEGCVTVHQMNECPNWVASL